LSEDILGEGRLTKTQAKKLEELSLTKPFTQLASCMSSNIESWV